MWRDHRGSTDLGSRPYKVAEAPTETVAETGTEAEGAPCLTGGDYGNPGSEWYGDELCRGMIDGVETRRGIATQHWRLWRLTVVFGEDGGSYRWRKMQIEKEYNTKYSCSLNHQ